MQNFIQLSLIVTKLCHVKRDRLVDFLHFTRKKINREKSRYLCNSMIDLKEIWYDNAEWVSQVHGLFKNKFKIRDACDRLVLHHKILQFFDF